MGFFDLAAPFLGAIDGAIAFAFPPIIRLALWGIFAGWLTMVVYRRLSNQEKITLLKNKQFDPVLTDWRPIKNEAV